MGRPPEKRKTSRPGELHLFVALVFLLLALLLFGLLVFLLVVLSERDGTEDEAEADCNCEDLLHVDVSPCKKLGGVLPARIIAEGT